MNEVFFRKATAEELIAMGFVLPYHKNIEYIEFAKKYYPKNAVKMEVTVNSVYNDNYYDNSMSYVVVYDENGNELTPLKETAKECRQKWFELSLPIEKTRYGYESTEQIENPIVISLLQEIPELYIIEK